MHILSDIILGLIVGFVAHGFLPDGKKLGLALVCSLGIAGSVMAQLAGQTLGWYEAGQPSAWIASVLAAAGLPLLVGLLRGRKSP
jgi:uncharacterized membrane protein YeaQ/YmgE (transglycosylase-associated protein family)